MNEAELTLSKGALLKSLVAAIAVAFVALFFVILPAEYAIDPSGIGAKMGLTQLTQDSSNKAQDKQQTSPTTAINSDTLLVTVPANKGIEFKFIMQKHQSMAYEWMSNRGALYFDLHGEPEGDTSGYFLSYAEATTDTMKGSFVAPFTGSHGWYWKNTENQDIQIQLMVQGNYTIKP